MQKEHFFYYSVFPEYRYIATDELSNTNFSVLVPAGMDNNSIYSQNMSHLRESSVNSSVGSAD